MLVNRRRNGHRWEPLPSKSSLCKCCSRWWVIQGQEQSLVFWGLKSKKLLFLGVRNRYCSVCTVVEHKGQTSPEHNCYRNWSGSSYAMESDVVAEGFWLSELTHGVRYLKLVSDGDSSVMSTILQSVQYGSYMYVEKIKCANHAVKCYPS